MTSILEELAAGRIDAAEAARRIDALKATPAPENSTAEATAEPSNDELTDASGPDSESEPDSDSDPWAAATDRPQHATYRTESFTIPPAEPEEPVRRRPVNTAGVERISVRASGRRVRIVGETSVATLSAD